MAKNKLDNWLGVLGNLAVVVGLIVVAVELNQNSVIANGELTSQFMSNWQNLDQSRQDPSFARVYAKSIERPEELTLAEKVQLDGYYWAMMDQLELTRLLVNSELFNSSYEKIVRPNVRIFLTTPYAQAWWAAYKRFADPATISIIDNELERLSSANARDFFDAIGLQSSG